MLTSQFLACHSSLLQRIKRRTSTTCHSVTQTFKKRTSRHRSGGAGEELLRLVLIFLSNLSFYVGSLLSP